MIESFGSALADAVRDSGGNFPRIVIAVSEEAETYLPEMEWLSEQLQKSGFSIEVCSPQELQILDDAVFIKIKKSI